MMRLIELVKRKSVSIVCLVLSMYFGFSALVKLYDMRGFVEIVAEQRIIRYEFIPTFAVILVLVELAIAIGLFIKRAQLSSSIFGAVLTIGLTIVIYFKFGINSNENCGCMGTFLEKRIDWKYYLLNSFLISLFIYVGIKVRMVRNR